MAPSTRTSPSPRHSPSPRKSPPRKSPSPRGPSSPAPRKSPSPRESSPPRKSPRLESSSPQESSSERESLSSRKVSVNDGLPPILRLPTETLDGIASYIDLHSDLVSLALACKSMAALVIPRHTEYRIIRVQHPMPAMWAHLARRADLARNIREVSIFEKRSYTTSNRFPHTLIDRGLDPASIGASAEIEEDRRVRNMCKALSHMRHLRVFTWSANTFPPSPPTIKKKHEDDIFAALSALPSLVHLGVLGAFGKHAPPSTADPDSRLYPLWTISKLQSLSLAGDAWVKPANAPQMLAMLKRSPDIQSLNIPMEVRGLEDCQFPDLKRLTLLMNSGARRGIDASRAAFIEAHPTVEDLCWYPLHSLQMKPDALPAIKRLRTNSHLLAALDEADGEPRAIECLDIAAMDPSALAELKCLDGNKLQKLKIYSYGDLESVSGLAKKFPSINWLSVPAHRTPTPPSERDAVRAPLAYEGEDWVEMLSHFPELEIFRGDAMWIAVQLDKDKMHKVIMELVQKCPKLRQLDHCDYDDGRSDWKIIEIIREGEEGEKVRYEIRKPLLRPTFDHIGPAFVSSFD